MSTQVLLLGLVATALAFDPIPVTPGGTAECNGAQMDLVSACGDYSSTPTTPGLCSTDSRCLDCTDDAQGCVPLIDCFVATANDTAQLVYSTEVCPTAVSPVCDNDQMEAVDECGKLSAEECDKHAAIYSNGCKLCSDATYTVCAPLLDAACGGRVYLGGGVEVLFEFLVDKCPDGTTAVSSASSATVGVSAVLALGLYTLSSVF